MTYHLTPRDVSLLREAMPDPASFFSNADDLTAAKLIAPELRALDPKWQPSRRHRERAAAVTQAALNACVEGTDLYEIVHGADAGVIARLLRRAAHSEQAYASEAAMTGDPEDIMGRLDKAEDLRRLAWQIERFYDENATYGQVIAYLATEYEVAREERAEGHSRRRRLAATLTTLLAELEPITGELLACRSSDGKLRYP